MTQLFVDSHCHLNLLADFKKTSDATSAIAEAGEQGVSHILCVSVDMQSLPDVLNISEQFDNVFASVVFIRMCVILMSRLSKSCVN